MTTTETLNAYSFEFSTVQAEEINSLGFAPFEPDPESAMTRGEWLAIADMCLGKIERLKHGDYDDGAEDDEDYREAWIDDLQSIADIILDFCKPGDGKL